MSLNKTFSFFFGGRSTKCKSIKNGDLRTQREREMFYLTTHSTHFIYGYMASDIWLRTYEDMPIMYVLNNSCSHISDKLLILKTLF